MRLSTWIGMPKKIKFAQTLRKPSPKPPEYPLMFLDFS